MSRLQYIGGGIQTFASGGGGGAGVTAPSNLVAQATLNTIDLDWDDNSGNETGFEVYRSLTGTGNPTTHAGQWTLAFTADEDDESGSDGNLAYSTQYFYIARALGYGSTTPSGWSNTVNVTTDEEPEDSVLPNFMSQDMRPGLYPLQLSGQAELTALTTYPLPEAFSFR